uniref:Uncharacterized protein n=1 Tax=Anguilla anguilla TaxID=7936 RepID=A0A0E9RFI4_ANGAN
MYGMSFGNAFPGLHCSCFQMIFVSGGFCLQSPLQQVECMLDWI